MDNNYFNQKCKKCNNVNLVYKFATKIKLCKNCSERLYSTTGGKIKIK